MSVTAVTSVSPLRSIKRRFDAWLPTAPGCYAAVDRLRHFLGADRRAYRALLQAGDVVVDVGANVGAHTRTIAQLVGSPGRVWALEPLPSNVRRIESVVRRAGIGQRTKIVSAAVGNPKSTDERCTIYVPGNDFTQCSLAVQNAGAWTWTERIYEHNCAIISIDQLLVAERLSKLDFIKIDCEGGELDVLRGASLALRQFQPLVYCEVYEQWAESFGYRPQDVFRIMQEVGYSDARVLSKHRVTAVVLHGRRAQMKFDVSANVLFFAEQHMARVRRFDRAFGIRSS